MQRSILVAGLVALPAAAALAHPGHVHEVPAAGAAAAFLYGLLHPLTGLDHLLAMVAVGLWAALAGGRALWALPLAFVVAMLAGGALGTLGVPMPAVEPVILASVIVLGALVALAARLPLGAAVALVALFGLAHGHAHGAEGPGGSLAAYAAGFTLATAALIVAGLGLGLALGRLRRPLLARALGMATVGAGAVLVLSPAADAVAPPAGGEVLAGRPAAEWIALGEHVHGGFGSLIALGIRIGADAMERLDAPHRGLEVIYWSHPDAPCPCVIDGLQAVTRASLGQRSLTLAPDPSAPDAFGEVRVRNRETGAEIGYIIPMSAWPLLRDANEGDRAERWRVVMEAPEEGLFTRLTMGEAG